MRRYLLSFLRIGCLFCLALGAASAQSFSFYSTLQAGRNSNSGWEVGVGSTSSASTATTSFSYDLPTNHYWRDLNGTQNFRIGWNATTNSAYTTVFDINGNPTTTTLVNSGAKLSANSAWTLPASSFLISADATNGPTSILVEGLALSPNTALVSGTLLQSFGAAQNAVAVLNTLPSPLVINAAANGGSWYLSGTIRFSGLSSQGGTAQGSQLKFLLGASGSQVPEATSLSLTAGGLIGLALLRSTRKGIGNRA